MVAYSFMKMFAPQVEDLSKRHTIRAPRKRHARPGEAVQLYTAMRTRHCRKLVTPDPICTRLDDIRLEVGEVPVPDDRVGYVNGIEINGRPLSDDETEAFAIADGFAPARLQPFLLKPDEVFRDWVTARLLMGEFWRSTHGLGGWQGHVIRWEPGEGPDG